MITMIRYAANGQLQHNKLQKVASRSEKLFGRSWANTIIPSEHNEREKEKKERGRGREEGKEEGKEEGREGERENSYIQLDFYYSY